MENQLKPQKVTTLFLMTTEACNLRCRYCFVHQNPKKMSYETAFKAVNYLIDNNPTGEIQVIFFGGEPTLRWNDLIVPIMLYGREVCGPRMTFSMTTNGLLLTDEKLKFFKEHGGSMLLSIDGIKEVQDLNRPTPVEGKSSFDIVSSKFDIIKKYFPGGTFRSTVNNDNVQYLFENYKFAQECGTFGSMFGAVNAYGEWTEEQYQTLEEQLFKIADHYLELKKQGINFEYNPLMSQQKQIKYGKDKEKICTSCQASTTVGFHKCGIGSNRCLVLGADEEFYTCQETPSNEKVREYFHVGSLATGIDEERRLEVCTAISGEKIHCSTPEYCNECKVKHLCDGFCCSRNYDMYGDFNIVPYPQCRYENILFKVNQYLIEKEGEGSGETKI